MRIDELPDTFYECDNCGQIYEDDEQAKDCCPNQVNAIPAEHIVACWKCKGEGDVPLGPPHPAYKTKTCPLCHGVPFKFKRHDEAPAYPGKQPA